ncbi:MAG TPA: SCO family protein [Silvibacterium sp.]|nr:SCO family protein [Silvibacterium sp.]
MKRLSARLFALIALGAIAGFTGCHSPSPGPNATQIQPVSLNTKQYKVRGVVVSTDAARGVVTLDAEAIPGYMDAMTMPYTLKDSTIISELHPGDTITATLLASNTSDLLDQIVVIAQAKADYKPSVDYRPLNPGTPVPDFKLLNQSGKLIRIDQFRGKVLLVTFIYTRCPLADYCPRMSRNFARLDKALAADPDLYAKTHLLSVSFDPEYDTPAVLRSYGGSYTGNYTQEKFAHWDFAAPPKAELAETLKFFLIGATPEKDRTITHSLSTIVITPDGKIYKWYPTNDWTPEQLLADVKELLSGKPHA